MSEQHTHLVVTPEEAAAIIAEAMANGEPVGWQVTDPDGNVVQSGPVSYAQLTSEVLEGNL